MRDQKNNLNPAAVAEMDIAYMNLHLKKVIDDFSSENAVRFIELYGHVDRKIATQIFFHTSRLTIKHQE